MAPRQAKPNVEKARRQSLVLNDQRKRPTGIKKERSQPSTRRSGRLLEKQHRQEQAAKDKDAKQKPSISLAKQTVSLQGSNQKRKRPQSEDPHIRTLAKSFQKRPRTSLTSAALTDTFGQGATTANKSKSVEYWIQEDKWPRSYLRSDKQTGKDLEKDSWIGEFKDEDWFREQFGDGSRMSLLIRRPKSSSSLRRKASESDTTIPSDQRPREAKSTPYAHPKYETILGTKGSFMGKSALGITDASKKLCRNLLEVEQSVPLGTLFRDDLFDEFCESMRGRNEAMVVRDISPLICPSAQVLRIYGAKHLKSLTESVNEGWNCAIPICGPRPQPDYAVAFGRSAFADDQLEKLKPLIGDVMDTFASLCMATWYMIFPFLTCEVKCGAAALDIADRQNAHSQTVGGRGLVELFRLVGREKELDGEIVGFSISHDDCTARLWAHYAVIDGPNTNFYRHSIHKFDFTALDGKEKWTAYKFTKNIYDIWMPTHLERICSAIDQLPADVNLTVLQRQFQLREGSGLSQELEGHHLSQRSDADSASLVGEDDGQSSTAGSEDVTPNTSISHGAGRRPVKRSKKMPIVEIHHG